MSSELSTKRFKVFGIGFHKTGTKTLKAALNRLGYRVTGPNGVKDREIARNAWSMCQALMERYNAFQDNPWPLFYKEIYDCQPNAKFVLTLRPTENWLKSAVAYFGTDTTPMREWIYGAGDPSGNLPVYRERYDRHNREVLEFFADKPGLLLVMDFSSGDGWEKLCSFLDEEHVPSRPFPHVNMRLPAKKRNDL